MNDNQRHSEQSICLSDKMSSKNLVNRLASDHLQYVPVEKNKSHAIVKGN